MLTELRVLDDILLAHAPQLGADLPAYRNHAYRVANLCAALRPPDTDGHDKVAIAAAMHDLGIWTAGTFDYLPPSAADAEMVTESAWCHRTRRSPVLASTTGGNDVPGERTR